MLYESKDVSHSTSYITMSIGLGLINNYMELCLSICYYLFYISQELDYPISTDI